MKKKIGIEHLFVIVVIGVLGFFFVSTMYGVLANKEYSQENLPGRLRYLEVANSYEKALGWNISPFDDNTAIFTWKDGNQVVYEEKWDVRPNAEKVVGLKDDLLSHGIDLLYVQAPNKISEIQDPEVSGVLDFSNQNMSEFLKILRENKVSYLDIRENIRKEKIDHHDLYYRTDNHWKGETGFWVSGILGRHIKENYPFETDIRVFEKERYRQEVYKDWWIGAAGKNLTLGRSEPEDFVMLYPEFETDISISIPYKKVSARGDFGVTYNKKLVVPQNFYKKYTYLAYGYGCQPSMTITNHLARNDTYILFIKDSFADSVYPFTSLSVKQVDVLDPRYYFFDRNNDISIREYIIEKKPDLVVMLYGSTITYFPNCTHFDYESRDDYQ